MSVMIQALPQRQICFNSSPTNWRSSLDGGRAVVVSGTNEVRIVVPFEASVSMAAPSQSFLPIGARKGFVVPRSSTVRRCRPLGRGVTKFHSVSSGAGSDAIRLLACLGVTTVALVC